MSKTLIEVYDLSKKLYKQHCLKNAVMQTWLSWRHRYRNDVIHADVVESRNAPPAEPIYD